MNRNQYRQQFDGSVGDCVMASPIAESRKLINVGRALTRRRTADRASVPISSSTFERIAACLPAAADHSRSLPVIRVRTPWPGIR